MKSIPVPSSVMKQIVVGLRSRLRHLDTAQKVKFCIKNFFSKYDQIRRKLQICSHLLKKSLMENFNFCPMPVIDDHCYEVDLLDHFSTCSKYKTIKDKSPPTVAQFWYDVISRYGCFEIQINDQWREFINEVNM